MWNGEEGLIPEVNTEGSFKIRVTQILLKLS